MTSDDIEKVAELVAEKIEARRADACDLSDEERQAVRELIATKKNAARAVLWLTGALFLWVLRDVYTYITGHMAFR